MKLNATVLVLVIW